MGLRLDSPPNPTFIQTMAQKNPSRLAFTLIELLVVLAVIGILAAILIPAVARVRGSANATESMSNLRSITQSYLMYASANDGRYPATGQFSEGSWGQFWPDRLIDGGFLELNNSKTYLEDRSQHSRQGVLWCPAEENSHGIADYGPNDNVVPHSRLVPPAVKILDPAKTVLVSESRRDMGDGEYGGSWWLKAADWIASAPNPQGSGTPLPGRHNGHLHVGFCDGHVEKISEERAIEDRATLFTGPYDSTNPQYNP